ncbi:hypothetical protein [Sulfurimonas sp. HSL3-2]|uniref:hypothetical protein n=1 Tax=Hydrocurvibacter mobilis TaxID=3131936 RepID=UPI0031F8B5FA
MKTLIKYENIENELPNLIPVLKQALQTDMLYIKKVNKECEQYTKECQHACFLTDAHYVIYSPYIKEVDHDRELFVFLDETGKTICHIGGNSIEIGGLIRPCENLKLSDEYKHSIKHHANPPYTSAFV